MIWNTRSRLCTWTKQRAECAQLARTVSSKCGTSASCLRPRRSPAPLTNSCECPLAPCYILIPVRLFCIKRSLRDWYQFYRHAVLARCGRGWTFLSSRIRIVADDKLALHADGTCVHYSIDTIVHTSAADHAEPIHATTAAHGGRC